MELKGKVVLITGGATGLGREISRQFAAAGSNLAIVYSRSQADAEDAQAELGRLGVKVTTHRCDVGVTNDLEALVPEVVSAQGRIDVVVNCAGTTFFIPITDLESMTEEKWDRIMAVNVKGPFLLARIVGPLMKKQGAGRIVNITSVAGLRPSGSSLAYAVSKAAENHLTRLLAVALGPEVLVNAVAPGAMDTRWWTGRRTPEDRERSAQNLPIKMIPPLSDIAEAVILCARNDAMTGQTMVVDGGGVMH